MTVLRAHLIVDLPDPWRIGTGTGVPAGVDAVVARDADGLPFIPAKTLTGLLSERAAVIARWLDDGERGAWTRTYRAVFGEGTPATEGAAALHVRPALLAVDTTIRAAPPTVTSVRASTAIDAASGVAREGSLRFLEEVGPGWRCVAPLALDTDRLRGAQLEGAVTLIEQAAALIVSIGAHRRRGMGGASVSLAAEGFRSDDAPVAPPPENAVRTRGDWTLIELTLTCLTPMLAASALVGNDRRGDEAIPGTYLLATVAEGLRATGCGAALIGEAIANGDLIVTAGTPSIAGRRAMPIPRSLIAPKNAPTLAAGGSAESAWVDQGVASGERETMKNHPAGWMVPSTSPTGWEATAGFVPMDDRAHAVIEAAGQRPTQRSGGLHTTRALAARTVLRCEVRWRAASLPADADALARHLHAREAAFGESRKDDYGHVWIEAAPAARSNEHLTDSEQVALLLRSHALVRDRRLQWSTNPDDLVRVIGAAIGRTDLSVATNADGKRRASLDTVRLAGWVSAWAMPRPTLVGIARGSCIEVRAPANAPITAAELRHLELAGIGERRAEGFGEVTVASWLLDSGGVRGHGVTIDRRAAGEDDPVSYCYTPPGLTLTTDHLPIEADTLAARHRARDADRRAWLGFGSSVGLSASNAGATVRRIFDWARDDDPVARAAEIDQWLRELVRREQCSPATQEAISRALSSATDHPAARIQLAVEVEEAVRWWRHDQRTEASS